MPEAAPSSLARRLATRLRRAVSHEIWNIGVVAQSAADIAARGIVVPVRWLPDPPAFTMLADPACREHDDGSLSLYAEQLDYRAPKGEIWHARVPPDGDVARAVFTPLIRGARHLSYPFPFADVQGRAWLTAESWQSCGSPVWNMQAGIPVAGAAWLTGRQPVDPTIFRHDGRWFLFCTFHDDAPDARLHVFHSETLDGDWRGVAGNPVRSSLFGSRPAGPIFIAAGHPIRPGQDCTISYGGAVVLHRILRLGPEGYEEETIRRLGPVAGRYGCGLHTLCPAGSQTLIDGKRHQADAGKAGHHLVRTLSAVTSLGRHLPSPPLRSRRP